ncbi:MAG: ATP-binding protein [Firmicutes bacterium]|nr:ATP-binding protein [Bacillota bacterium]
MVRKIEFEIQSEMKNLAVVRQRVEEMAADCGFTDTDIYQMKVAVSEAVANAIEHGSPNGPRNRVQVLIECDGDKIVIEVLDQGIFKARLPVTDGRPSHRGRGIFLMTALMDEVNITERQDGTLVRLVKLKEPAMEKKQHVLS